MASPTLEGFGKLKSKQLIEIGDRYELRLKIRMKKKRAAEPMYDHVGGG